MSDNEIGLPAPAASIMADHGAPLPPGTRTVTASGVPLTRIPSRQGLLTWNGTEVELVPAYPADARWLAWSNRDPRGGWWVAYHEFARGEHMYRANHGPLPRVLAEEFLEQRANRAPDAVMRDIEAPGQTLHVPEPPDPIHLDSAAMEAVRDEKRIDDLLEEAGADVRDPQETKPTTDPERWD